ncbi:MAG: DUF4815 domain-containing protein, partial [Thaumarchaeota archaeon]|nr:DUF4815 domain-containing protein [Nitrososphaerota archaeon]
NLKYANVGSSADIFKADVIATISVTSRDSKSKTLVTGNTTVNHAVLSSAYTADANTRSALELGQIVYASANTSVEAIQWLHKPDVRNISAIIEGSISTGALGLTNAFITAVSASTSNTNNITSRYEFYTGQSDNYYDHSYVKLKAGQTPPTNGIMIIFDHYTWSANDGFFTVDSYPDAFADIPTHTSPTTGQVHELRDVVDFRPQRPAGTYASGWPAKSATSISHNYEMPDVDTSMTTDIQYYLGRKDKLVLTKDRIFKAIQGIPRLNPVLPSDDEDSMTMYNLDIPAYTFNSSDIDTQYIDNRRFTMRDIGKIEKRMDMIEYYTSLSILEKDAKGIEIRDATSGVDRFKNGILVDSFKGHSVGDVTTSDYACAIDFETNELRPTFSSESYKFGYDSSGSSSSVQKTGDLVTLSYSSANLVVQPLASNNATVNVNPFSTSQFNGLMTLTPPNSVWMSQAGRPVVLINTEGVNDAWIAGSTYGFGKQWDDWSYTWTGIQVNNDNLLKKR